MSKILAVIISLITLAACADMPVRQTNCWNINSFVPTDDCVPYEEGIVIP